MKFLTYHWKTKLICLVLAAVLWGSIKERQERGFLHALFTGNLPGESAHAPSELIPELVPASADDTGD